MRICNKCGVEKSLDLFTKDKRRPLGRRGYCKACEAAQKRTYWADGYGEKRNSTRRGSADPKPPAMTPDERREHNRNYWSAWYAEKMAEDPLYGRISQGRKRANATGARADIFTGAELRAYWEANGTDPDACYVCGAALSWAVDREAQIDHVHPIGRGGEHTMANLAPSCGPCNRDRRDIAS